MFRPLLAAKITDPKLLRYPLLGSYKYDGIRALVCGEGQVMSRTMKAFPNLALQRTFGLRALVGVEGEFIVGNPTDPGVLQTTYSVVMSRYAPINNLNFYVFDYWLNPLAQYLARLQALADSSGQADMPNVYVVQQVSIRSAHEAVEFEEAAVELGFEGVMLRSMVAPYKHGRSTLNEQYLLKWKRFEDGEAEILSVHEGSHNANAAQQDELGYTKRSKAQAGLVGNGTLGYLHVKDVLTGVTFDVGSGPGMTLAVRQGLWNQRDVLPGCKITYRYQATGNLNKPRSPRFVALRDDN